MSERKIEVSAALLERVLGNLLTQVEEDKVACGAKTDSKVKRHYRGGYIRKRGNSYQLAVSLGKDETGKYKYAWTTVHCSQEEAEQILLQLSDNVEKLKDESRMLRGTKGISDVDNLLDMVRSRDTEIKGLKKDNKQLRIEASEQSKKYVKLATEHSNYMQSGFARR